MHLNYPRPYQLRPVVRPPLQSRPAVSNFPELAMNKVFRKQSAQNNTSTQASSDPPPTSTQAADGITSSSEVAGHHKENGPLSWSYGPQELVCLQRASGVIGYEYKLNAITNALGLLALERKPSIDDLSIGNSLSSFRWVTSHSTQSNVSALEQEIKAQLNVSSLPNLFPIQVETSYSSGSQVSSTSLSTSLTSSVLRIHNIDVRLTTDMKVVKPSDAGHCFVEACSLLTGYVIHCSKLVNTAAESSLASSESKVTVGVPVLDSGVNLSKNWLSELSKGNSKGKYFVSVIGFGGFSPKPSLQLDSIESVMKFASEVEALFEQELPTNRFRNAIVNPDLNGGHLRKYPSQLKALYTSTVYPVSFAVPVPLLTNQENHPLMQMYNITQSEHARSSEPVLHSLFQEEVSNHASSTEHFEECKRPDRAGSISNMPEAHVDPTTAQFCTSFSETLFKHISEQERRSLAGLSYSRLLTFILLTFPGTISSYNQLRMERFQSTDSVVVVLGPSGTGKSTLIGHSLANPLQWRKDGRLEYANQHIAAHLGPPLGHTPDSVTLGCKVYNGGIFRGVFWIDTGGTSDRRGIEADLVNAMSLSLVLCGPFHRRMLDSDFCGAASKSILIMIDSAAIKHERALKFRELIMSLGNGIKNITDAAVWRSIVFIVNDKEAQTKNVSGNLQKLSKQERLDLLKEEIAQNIKTTETQINDLLGDPSFSDWFKCTVMDQKKQQRKKLEKVRKTDEARAKKIEAEIKCRELLHLAYTHFDSNFVIADMDPLSPEHTRTTQDIVSRIGSGKLSTRYLELEYMFERQMQSSSTVAFKTFMQAVVSYFNERHDELKTLLVDYDKFAHKLQDLAHEMQHTQQMIDNASSTVDHRQLIIEITREEEQREKEKLAERAKLEAEVETHDKQIDKCSADIIEQQNDNTVVELVRLVPQNVQRRGFWNFFGDWYPFEYKEKIPIHEARFEGFAFKEGSTVPVGTYEILEQDLAEGSFRSRYKPGHWGYDESQIRVIVNVLKKHHTSTVVTVRELEASKAASTSKRAEANKNLQSVKLDLQSFIAHRVITEANAKKLEQERQALEEVKVTLQARLEQLQNEFDSCESSRNHVVKSLSRLRSMFGDPSFKVEKHVRNLILETINAFDLQTLREKDTFVTFVGKYVLTSQLYDNGNWSEIPEHCV